MSWSQYTIVFRLDSPLHIGLAKTGNLKQCRDHVPGRVLWAALTARLTRSFDNGANGRRYLDIGNKVRQCFRFGYLYPAIPKTDNDEVRSASDLHEFSSRWNNDGFDFEFVGSYASTALDYNDLSSEDGTLHETEHLLPFTRAKAGFASKPVYLVGHIYVEDQVETDAILKNWRVAMGAVQLGAERKYGWGRVTLVSCLKTRLPSSAEVIVPFAENDHIPAHAVAVTASGLGAAQGVKGPVEPLVGWEYTDAGTGKSRWRLTPRPILCYRPGSVVEFQTVFHVDPYGLLYNSRD